MKINPAVSEKRKAGRPTVDRRDEILDAAERLYDALGFEKVTVTDVARALGMSPANLYRSFANRQAIDEAVTRRSLSVIEDAAWRVARTAHADPLQTFEQLCMTISRETRDLLFSRGRASDLCLAATRGHWPPVRDFMDTLHGVIRHVIAEGQRQGVMRPELPLEETAASAVCAMAKVWHPIMLDTFGVEALEEETAGLARLVLEALRRKN
ncbi:TetR/AcrR family transcriptional regulator [Novosphingobium sp.]|uniref:TetR/AcrR family transcriptional regulator n=1 Tax=Novosphingobium sp. TaxID=1874826 RepID=UPI003BAAEC5E